MIHYLNITESLWFVYISACHDNTADGWTIDIDSDSDFYTNKFCSKWGTQNWYGFKKEIAMGSISTTFIGRGRARLVFGNCWASGTVKVYLDRTVIAFAPGNTPSKTVEFNFKVGSILRITEEDVAIVSYNLLHIIQCNGVNNPGEYLLNIYIFNYTYIHIG